MSAENQSRDAHELGVWAMPLLGQAYPELQGLLHKLYSERIAAISWVPRDWLRHVTDLQNAEPSALIRVTPGVGLLSPVFCDTAEKKAWWQEFYKMTDAAVFKFANGKVDEGREEMRIAQRNTGFFYRAAQLAIALPGLVVEKVLDVGEGVAGGILGKLLKSWLVWVAIVLALAYAAFRLGFFKGK